MSDLVMLVADKQIDYTMRGILSRAGDLRVRSLECDIYVHDERDPGCLIRSAAFLRPFHRDYDHALVVFDRVGSGGHDRTATQLEASVERELRRNGWDDRAAVVVLDPELEAWIWTDSVAVGPCLGWRSGTPALRRWLRDQDLWPTGDPKPPDPKAAAESALRKSGTPRSAAVYRKLAEQIDFDGCQDRAFAKLRATLQGWFSGPLPGTTGRP